MAEDPPAQPDAPASGQPALSPLLAQVIDRWESEGPVALDAVCREHPEQAEALRERVERLRRAGLIGETPADAALPARLGNFRILSLLGRGGMGVVYLAEQEELGRRVALKLVRPEHLLFPGARERFRREVAAVAKMQHPGIVPVHAAGEAGGIPYCAMELVRGAALEEVLVALAGRPPARLTGADLRGAIESVMHGREPGMSAPPPQRASSATRGSSGSQAAQRFFGGTWTAACLTIAHDVALALQHAHEQGVLHRDVKPSNVMVTPEGRVLLLDFGLAAAEGGARITRTGSQLGSLAWMSPEQVRGARELDARTDVYSLGATLYELLTLRSPFAVGGADETRARILAGRAVPIRDLNPAVPRDAETVCWKAMDADAARRYATPAAFADDLLAALELRPVAARRPSALLKARRWAQRNPAGAAAAVLGAVLLVGGPVGYGLLQARAATRERGLNADLQATNGKLDAALADVRTANDGLTQQRDRAQRAFDRSRDAVDELLATVGSEDLKDLPQFEPVRTKLLERALDFYRSLLTEAPGDVNVAREQARTHHAMGDLLRELGRHDEARALYEQATTELTGVLAQAPDDPPTQRALATNTASLAALEYTQGKFDDAQRHWTDARERLERLVAAPDSKLENVHDLAATITDLAMIAHSRGDVAGALEMFRHSADVSAPGVAAHPEDIDIARTHAEALGQAASAASDLGHADESAALFGETWDALTALLPRAPTDRALREQAVEIASNYGLMLLTRTDHQRAEAVLRGGFQAGAALARDFPQQPTYARNCAVIGINLVAELINENRFSDAEPIVTECVARMQRVVADHPDLSEDVYFLGYAESALSAVHEGLGRLDDAAREADEGVARLREARTKMGDVTGLIAQLACGLYQRADVACAAGDPVLGLQTIEDGMALGCKRPDIVYMACETLAKCTRTARDATALPAAQRDTLRARAEDLCLQTLRDAIARGFTDLQRVRTIPEFELVRARPEFADILNGASSP